MNNYERLYSFKNELNQPEWLTLSDAIKIPLYSARIQQILQNSSNKRMTKDGFEPGFQANINEVINDRSTYDKRLRELNLIELGYDAVPKDTTTVSNHCATLEFALAAKEEGVDLSDGEIDAIASGEYFENAQCDLSGDY